MSLTVDHPWRLVATAFAAGAMTAAGKLRSPVVRRFADLLGELFAMALVARAQSWIDMAERRESVH